MPVSQPVNRTGNTILAIAPGVLLAALVAATGYYAAHLVGTFVPIPAMMIALIIGIALNPIAAGAWARPGLAFSVRTILRAAVALMGLRIAFNDIAALGASTAILIVVAMAVTIVSGFLLARRQSQRPEFGALVGVATGVCGASATLAVSTVVPNYPGKQADVAFVIVAVNAFATLTMIVYPLLCGLLGFDPQATGVMLGGTIHDVAQVAGAGYAISDEVGNTAIITKLFRVFLLLPVVLCVGFYFARQGGETGEARVAVPLFAIAFLALSALNSAMPLFPSVLPGYLGIRSLLVEISSWGLLLAVAALGLSTSLKQIVSLGSRHVGTVAGTTIVILVTVTAGLVMMR